MLLKLETIIGLEVHIELKTKTKLFCSCPNCEEAMPNTNICPICLGHPGVLPVLNEEALKKILLLGKALGGKIPETASFDRKSYFYPDLPKGYQISQFFLPLVKGGFLEIEIDNQRKKINLERIHLEEDAAKLLHSDQGRGGEPPSRRSGALACRESGSFVDFNRAGVPLAELVTRPELRSPGEAKVFLETLRLIARYLDISEAEMQKGQMRCDANVSLRPIGEKVFFAKTEIKNLNSFRAVEDALSYEIKRQTEFWEEGNPPQTNSTRGWDEKKKNTLIQREKEESFDYRYFPEPDLPFLEIKNLPFWGDEFLVEELPLAKKDRFIKMYGFSSEEAKILTSNLKLADFTEKIISELKKNSSPLDKFGTLPLSKFGTLPENEKKLMKLTANWLINRLWPAFAKASADRPQLVDPKNFVEFILLIFQNKISSTLGQQVLGEMVETGKGPNQIIEKNKLEVMADEGEIEKKVKEIIEKNPKVVADFKKGKENVLQFLIGLVMKETKGKAEPKLVREILKKIL